MLKTIECYNNRRKINAFIYEMEDETYYVEQGGTIVNVTHEKISEKTDLNNLEDVHTLSCRYCIDTIEEFQQFLDV